MKRIHFIAFNIMAAIFIITAVLGINGCHKNKSQTDYNILVIHSFDSLYTWGKEIKEGINDAFSHHNLSVKIRHFYLNCEMLNARQEIDTLSRLLDEYTYDPPHMILIEDDQATFSLITSNHPITHIVPIIFSGVSYLNCDILTGYNNITGFECKRDFIACYKLAKHIIPNITRINILTDSTVLGQSSRKEFLKQWQTVSQTEKEKIKIKFIPYREMKTFRVLYPFYNASKGDIFILPKWDFIISQFSNISAQPFFTVCNEGIGENITGGILGGIFTLPYQQGFDGANLAAQILKGEKTITNVPLQYHKDRPVFDWPQIKRLNISKSQLPENSFIYNIPIYEKYKTEFIIIILTAFILLFFLIFLYLLEKKKKKRIQIRLHNKQELLEQALQVGNFHTWSYDLITRKLTFDKHFFQSTGLPLTENYKINRISLIRRIHPDDRRNVYNTLLSSIYGKDAKVVVQFRISLNSPDEYEWWETHFSLSPYISYSNAQIYGLCSSIEHIKQREMELIVARDLAAKAELRQSFVANISHEIRIPLNAIIGFTNLLSDENLDNETRRQCNEVILQNSELLLKLINDVIDLSSLEFGKIQFCINKYNVVNICRNVIDTVSKIKQTQAAICFITELESMDIETDDARLQQVLINLLINATKFTSQGSIILELRKQSEQELLFFVTDTGCGIPKEKQAAIFRRFEKLNENAQGSGLGLSICQLIIEHIGGKIWIDSDYTGGSRFFFTHPIRQSQSTNPKKENNA